MPIWLRQITDPLVTDKIRHLAQPRPLFGISQNLVQNCLLSAWNNNMIQARVPRASAITSSKFRAHSQLFNTNLTFKKEKIIPEYFITELVQVFYLKSFISPASLSSYPSPPKKCKVPWTSMDPAVWSVFNSPYHVQQTIMKESLSSGPIVSILLV